MLSPVLTSGISASERVAGCFPSSGPVAGCAIHASNLPFSPRGQRRRRIIRSCIAVFKWLAQPRITGIFPVLEGRREACPTVLSGVSAICETFNCQTLYFMFFTLIPGFRIDKILLFKCKNKRASCLERGCISQQEAVGDFSFELIKAKFRLC